MSETQSSSSRNDPINEPLRAAAVTVGSNQKQDWRTSLGIICTAIWLLFLALYLAAAVGLGNIFNLPIAELGSFLEGAFAPLAFLWFVLAYYSQQKELSQNTEAIRTQSAVIELSARQAEIQAQAIQASEMHARRESFLRVADNVKEQLGAILGFLYISSQGMTGSGQVSAERLSKLWNDMGQDPEIFARQLLELTSSMGPSSIYKVLYGTEVRTRHSENFVFNFERLLDAAEDCDTNGMIRDAIMGGAFGYVYQRLFDIKDNVPEGFKYGVYDFDPDELSD